MDPNTSSNYQEFNTRHINLDWIVDFQSRCIRGEASLTVENISDDSSELRLDASFLDVYSVEIDDEPAEFSCDPEGGKFGGVLRVSGCTKKSFVVGIKYKTTDQCTALQWLAPEQTSGKKDPFLYSQCQAILARSLLPCQDTPSIKSTYSASVLVAAPYEHLSVVMSANDRIYSDGLTRFTQNTPIPSYLIAIGVGDLKSCPIGPRSSVWCEAEQLDGAVFEFGEAESYLKAAEDLLGPYVWGRYDILVLPPSFPYGGMENPCLTFLTPSLLAGDRSLVSVVVHEITHSWTGNLVTNSSWEHFWINEGFTKFVERKIIGRLQGEPVRELLAQLGLGELRENIDFFGHDHNLTRLIPDLSQISPDDAYSRVPYEKGHAFLYHLEQVVGGPAVFDPYLRAHVKRFSGISLDSTQWKAFLFEFFNGNQAALDGLRTVDFDRWLNAPGMPPVMPLHDQTLMLSVNFELEKWIGGTWEKSTDQWNSFTVHQKILFLELLDERTKGSLPAETLTSLDTHYQLTKIGNVEIGLKWFMLCLHNSYRLVYEAAAKFATIHGRMKYCRPILRALGGLSDGRDLAIKTFQSSKSFYHPQAVKMIEIDLNL